MKYGKGFENYTKEEQSRIALGRQVASEGMVLLENNGALPLKGGAGVALFGVGQIGFLHGGSGSGGTFANYVVKLPEAMENAGALVDQALLAEYTDYCIAEQKKVEQVPPFMRRGTIDELVLPDRVVESAAERNDTAIISFARLAGEGQDRKLEKGDYYLSDEEHALLRSVRAHFKTVIVLLNICGTVDMNWVDLYKPDGVLLVWIPGQEGASAAADILMGHVNPSGRLTDTIAKSWEDIPSSENFGAWADGFESYTGDENQIPYWGGVGNHEMVPIGETVVRPVGNRRYTEYQEGLYIGYRFFSTFGVEAAYPFGYGLSYTTFDRRASDFKQADNGIAWRVTVTNTGTKPGKEVVQIYLHGAEDPLERPDRELIAFAKTKELQPGEAQTIDFAVDYRSFAVYNEEKAAWMLQSGENTLYLGGDSLHNVEFASFDTQEALLEQVSNRVRPDHHTRPLNVLSKHDPEGTRPTAPPLNANSGEKHGSMKDDSFEWPPVPVQKGKWQLKDVKNGTICMEEFVSQLSDFELVVLLIGANLTGHSAVETMDKSVEQGMPVERMMKQTQLGPLSECVPGMGGYTATIKRLGIPTITMCDGPAGIGAGKDHKLAFPTATITACTWNAELAEELGEALGAEAEERKVDVWLAPAFNIHRNPLAGRNYEYYSEDPLVSGKIAAAVVRGAQKHPVSACLKHFAANNQETSRWDKDDSVMTERVLREIYLKGFEIAVKESDPHSLMTSYNPLNGKQTATNRELLQNILRDEWGFGGFVVTDWEGDTGLAVECIQAGNDLLMPGFPGMVDWLYRRVEDGTLDRSDLETCAGRLLNVVMRSAAMERYLRKEKPDGRAENTDPRPPMDLSNTPDQKFNVLTDE